MKWQQLFSTCSCQGGSIDHSTAVRLCILQGLLQNFPLARSADPKLLTNVTQSPYAAHTELFPGTVNKNQTLISTLPLTLLFLKCY